jgi:hypothetical protein
MMTTRIYDFVEAKKREAAAKHECAEASYRPFYGLIARKNAGTMSRERFILEWRLAQRGTYTDPIERRVGRIQQAWRDRGLTV